MTMLESYCYCYCRLLFVVSCCSCRQRRLCSFMSNEMSNSVISFFFLRSSAALWFLTRGWEQWMGWMNDLFLRRQTRGRTLSCKDNWLRGSMVRVGREEDRNGNTLHISTNSFILLLSLRLPLLRQPKWIHKLVYCHNQRKKKNRQWFVFFCVIPGLGFHNGGYPSCCLPGGWAGV